MPTKESEFLAEGRASSTPYKQRLFMGVLDSFGVHDCSTRVRPGRFFDDYEIFLPQGMRFSKIEALLEDIGIHMRSVSIPKGRVSMSNGSYIVSIQKRTVSSPDMPDLLKRCFSKSRGLIPIALGVDKSGKDIFFDLNKMPNLLVSGATGSGKSVLLHNIIVSAMCSMSQVILVDPKYVEFSMYDSMIGRSNILNTASELKGLLESYLIPKMNATFEKLRVFKCRNVVEFNNKYPKLRINPTVLVIDEWADLFYSDKTIVKSISGLAAKCRAAGISIVLATQRPSADVISGIIKANFPGRIALKVSSSVDSRIILDKTGAERLTEKGEGIILNESGQYKYFKTGYIENIGRFLNENFTRCH